MADKDCEAGSSASWPAWRAGCGEATSDVQQTPIYTERNIPDTPMPYEGQSSPLDFGGRVSGAAKFTA